MSDTYVHGYSQDENTRLLDQASTLADLLHCDTVYLPGATVLEAGCGVGAQTELLARNNPKTRFIAFDLSLPSLLKARQAISTQGRTNVIWQAADIFNLPFADNSIDHVFVCFTLEHLKDPLSALLSLRSVLSERGTLTVIEGDHGSAYFYPESTTAQKTIDCLVDLQRLSGGNARIGRQLYPLLKKAGFEDISISPRMIYADSSKPVMVEGFTKKTFIAMVEGVRDKAIGQGMVDKKEWETGIASLYRTTEEGGTFCYTFFKAIAKKSSA